MMFGSVLLVSGCMSVSAAEPQATYLDFEGVSVNASAPRPEIKLINEVMHNACPARLDQTSAAWMECVVNLSYLQIKDICGKLGEQTPALVNALFGSARPAPLFQHDADGEIVDWRGCFFNSRNGSAVGGYRWHGTGSGWILTNGPEIYELAQNSASQTSLTVFDGLPIESAVPSAGQLPLNAIFAYRLTPQVSPGMWLATRSETNQDRINQALNQMNLFAPYCGTVQAESGSRPCTKLPSLSIMAISPTLMVVRSLAPQLVGYQVHGIFWKSVTGHNIMDDVRK